MKPNFKLMSSLLTVAALSLAAVSNARAESAALDARTDSQVRACVAEIGRHADYADATRVVHVIGTLHQKNLEELAIRVQTSVYVSDDSVREYAARCVTGTLGKVVRFRLDAADEG